MAILAFEIAQKVHCRHDGLRARPMVTRYASSFPRRESADRFNELCRSDAQAVRQLHDVEQADIPLASLHPAHVVAMQVGQFRQFLL